MSKPFRDHYFQRAKKESYAARSVYKLQEIQKKYKLLRRGDRVLDLGAAPGSWMQLACEAIGPKGHLVGVDLKKIEQRFPSNVLVLEGDVTDPAFQEDLAARCAPFSVVMSDMAPATTGIRVADSARSELLFEAALQLAERTLKPGGHFLAKIFQGSDFHNLLQEVKRRFAWVKVIKPEASKKKSKEIYILAMRYKNPLSNGKSS